MIAGLEFLRRFERTIPVPQVNIQAIMTNIRGHQVQDSIAIQIGSRQAPGGAGKKIFSRGLEGAVPISEEHRHCTESVICYSEI